MIKCTTIVMTHSCNPPTGATEMNNEIDEEFDYDSEEYALEEDNSLASTSSKGEKPVEIVDERGPEEIMLEAFKNAACDATRTNALMAICSQLQKHYVPEFINNHKKQIADIIRVGLNPKHPAPMELSVRLVPLVAFQLENQNSMKEFESSLMDALGDTRNSFAIRSTVCRSLAILKFLWAESLMEITDLMSRLSGLFEASYWVDGMIHANLQFAEYDFHIVALEAWTFLLTIGSPQKQRVIYFPKIISMTKHMHFELRYASARTIAVVYESGHEMNKSTVEYNKSQIVQNLNDISKYYYLIKTKSKMVPAVLQYFKVSSVHRWVDEGS